MKKYISRFLKFLIRQTLYFNLHFLYAYLITKATLINYSKSNESILVFGRVSSDMDLLIKIQILITIIYIGFNFLFHQFF